MQWSGPLSGIRVIDFGQYIAGPLLARLLADAGAEVIRVERPGGPSLDDPGNAYLLDGRAETRTLDLNDAQARQAASDLIASADVVIENFRPGKMAQFGLDSAASLMRKPSLIYCSLPGFAAADVRASRAGWEGVIMAEGSAFTRPKAISMFFDGVAAENPPFSSLPLASVFAATLAALAVSSALIARDRDGGRGQAIEVPLSDALLEASGIASTTIERPADISRVLAFGAGLYRGRDGGVLCNAVVVHRHLVAIAEAAGRQDWIESGLVDYDRLLASPEQAKHLREELIALFATRDAKDWEDVLRPAGVPIGMLRSTRGFLRDPAALASGGVIQKQDPELGALRMPGQAVNFEHRGQAGPRPSKSAQENAAPLAGFKVMDLSRVVAAPTAARLLADLGADVVKIDRDPSIAFVSSDEPTFHVYVNRGKDGEALNLKVPEERARFDQRLADADVMIANAIPSRLEALGLGDDAVRKINPGIIFGYLNAYGTKGPWADYRGYAEIGNAVTGLAHLSSGWHAKPSGSLPSNFPSWPYTDSMAGILCAFGVVAALFDRQRSGAVARVETTLVNATLLEQLPYSLDAEGIDPIRGRNIETPTYRVCDASDGQLFIAIHADDVAEACERLGIADAETGEGAIADAIRPLTVEDALEQLNFGRSAAGRLRTLADTMAKDSPWAARGLRIERDSPDFGVVITHPPILNFSRTPIKAGETPRFFGKLLAEA